MDFSIREIQIELRDAWVESLENFDVMKLECRQTFTENEFETPSGINRFSNKLKQNINFICNVQALNYPM